MSYQEYYNKEWTIVKRVIYTLVFCMSFMMHGMEEGDEQALQSNDKKFFKAIERGNVGLVKLLLARDVNLHKVYPKNKKEYCDLQGLEPLQVAIKKKRYIIASMLLAKGAQVTVSDELSPLHSVVDDMLSTVDYGKDNSIFACDRHIEFLSLLLCHGADISTQDRCGQTFFHYICSAWKRESSRSTIYNKVLKAVFLCQSLLPEYLVDNEDTEAYRTGIKETEEKLKNTLMTKDNKGKTILDLVCDNEHCDHSEDCRAKGKLHLRKKDLSGLVQELQKPELNSHIRGWPGGRMRRIPLFF